MNRITKLIQLSAKADQLINFAYNDEEENEGHLLRNTAIAGAAGAGGLYAAGRGAIGPVQPGLAGIGQTISQGASRVGGAVSSAAGGMKDTFMKGYGKGGIMRGIRGLARSLTKGKSRFVGLSSRSALVQLNAKLDEVIEFQGQPQENDYIPRYLLGSPLMTAIKAEKGHKWSGFKDQFKHTAGQAAIGGAGGASLGAGIGALAGRSKAAAGLGAAVGGYLGILGGGLKGNFDRRSTEIYHRNQRKALA